MVGELHVVREQRAHTAQAVLEGEDLLLELDAVIARNLRSHVERGGGVAVRMAELEDDLRIAHGKAVLVGEAPAQDEGVVVEAEVLRIEEQHLANLRPQALGGAGIEIHTLLLGHARDDLREIEEALQRGEAQALEDDLRFEVMHIVERVPVRIKALGGVRPLAHGLVAAHRRLPASVSAASHVLINLSAQGSSGLCDVRPAAPAAVSARPQSPCGRCRRAHSAASSPGRHGPRGAAAFWRYKDARK